MFPIEKRQSYRNARVIGFLDMLNALSIRTKIASIVSLLLLALIGMGLLAASNLRSLNANTAQIAAEWLPNVEALGQLQAGTIAYRATLRSHLLAETVEDKEVVEKSLRKVAESNDAIRASYSARISSAQERQLYDDWSRRWQDYTTMATQVVELSRQEAGHLPRQALELNKQAFKIGNEADATLAKEVALNHAGAESESHAAQNTYWSSLMMLAVIVGTAALLGAGAGSFVVRDVSRGIASIVAPMQALGAGDLVADVPHRGEQTEIGAMADALQIFKEALVAKKAADEVANVDAEAKIERSRRVDVITREFEQMIGQVVGNVSSASAQLETSAGTLSANATRSRELSTAVAAASSEASSNVQSVASATEELSPRSTRSAGRCRNRHGWPATRWGRRIPPRRASANCRRPPRASATSSN
jgi:methyl-accepting chemotaxis protein